MRITRGEIWLVNLDPQVGAEMRKSRPVVVISSDDVGRMPLRIVVPFSTQAKDMPWIVPVGATAENKLDRDTYADCFQVKSVSTNRFKHRIGHVSGEVLEEIIAGVVLCIGYCPRA